jgi:hypothetical protein
MNMTQTQRLVPARPASPSAHRAPIESSLLSADAAHGVDILWKHQIRKEHAALLEALEAANKSIEAVSNDRRLQDADERLMTLEVKLSRTQSELRKDKQVRENWSEEAQALKQKLEAFDRRLTDGKCLMYQALHVLTLNSPGCNCIHG